MEKYYLAAFNFLSGCGPRQVRILVNYFKSAENVWHASAQELLACKFLSESDIDNLLTLRAQGTVDNLAEACHVQNINILTYLDADYPENLHEIVGFPTSLFYKGKPLSAIQNPLGVVGPRLATEYAYDVVRYFVEKLAGYNMTIISGGARGVDTMAHRTALQCGLHTVAVLGCGLDITYPRENGDLFAEIAERGTLLSEYPPGVKPIAKNFPARNRIISGLSKGVILPEAGQKSGSLITAEFALDQGREVYCVPGNIFSVNSYGVHSLIKQGAKLTSIPEDLLEDYFPDLKLERTIPVLTAAAQPAAPKQVQLPLLETPVVELESVADVSAPQRMVLKVLQYDRLMGMDEIHMDCNLDIGELNLALLELEILGHIRMDIRQRKYVKIRGVD